MADKKVPQLEVSKETVELYEGVAKIVEKLFEVKGMETGAAVAAVAAGSIEPVLVALQGIDKVKAEHEEDAPEASAAHFVGSALIAKAIAKGLKG